MSLKRKVGLVAIFTLLIIVGFVWKSNLERESSISVATPNKNNNNQPSEQLTALGEDVTNAVDKRTVSVLSPEQSEITANPSTRDTEEADPEIVRSIAADRMLSAVESGDLKLANEAYILSSGCRNVALTEEGLERRHKAVEKTYGDSDTPVSVIMAFDDALSSQEQMQSDCEILNRDKTDFLDQELTEKATNGNQVARFVLAMWSPNDELGLLMGGDLLLEHEATALGYTLDNLHEGHPLGLLALGISYSTGDYFTPQRLSLGSAFLIASKLCSNGEINIEGRLGMNTMMIGAQSRALPVATNESMLEMGTKLYEFYCSTSISNSMK